MRTGIRRNRLADMMTAETWMNARKAVELKFADRVGTPDDAGGVEAPEPMIFSRAAVTNSLLSKIQPQQKPVPQGTNITAAIERLNFLDGGIHNVKTA
jgi:ATP-dependent Clp protease protease subunit